MQSRDDRDCGPPTDPRTACQEEGPSRGRQDIVARSTKVKYFGDKMKVEVTVVPRE